MLAAEILARLAQADNKTEDEEEDEDDGYGS
jgi:hypothetical protein